MAGTAESDHVKILWVGHYFLCRKQNLAPACCAHRGHTTTCKWFSDENGSNGENESGKKQYQREDNVCKADGVIQERNPPVRV
jgi:hypothetical protein